MIYGCVLRKSCYFGCCLYFLCSCFVGIAAVGLVLDVVLVNLAETEGREIKLRSELSSDWNSISDVNGFGGVAALRGVSQYIQLGIYMEDIRYVFLRALVLTLTQNLNRYSIY